MTGTTLNFLSVRFVAILPTDSWLARDMAKSFPLSAASVAGAPFLPIGPCAIGNIASGAILSIASVNLCHRLVALETTVLSWCDDVALVK